MATTTPTRTADRPQTTKPADAAPAETKAPPKREEPRRDETQRQAGPSLRVPDTVINPSPIAVIAMAMIRVMRTVRNVEKKGHNEHFKYDYVTEPDLLERLIPAMLDNGLVLIPSAEDVRPYDAHGNAVVVYEYHLIHESGAVWPKPIRVVGAGNDKSKGGVGDKGYYKASTGANKYLLSKLFQIATGDDPETADNSHTIEPTRPNQGGNQNQNRGGNQQRRHVKPSDMLSLGDEKAFQDETLKRLSAARDRGEVDTIMRDPETMKALDRSGQRTVDRIREVGVARYRELPAPTKEGSITTTSGTQRRDEGGDRRDDRREPNHPREQRETQRRDEGRDGGRRENEGRTDDRRGGYGDDHGDYGRDDGYQGGTGDDDIPF